MGQWRGMCNLGSSATKTPDDWFDTCTEKWSVSGMENIYIRPCVDSFLMTKFVTPDQVLKTRNAQGETVKVDRFCDPLQTGTWTDMVADNRESGNKPESNGLCLSYSLGENPSYYR